LSAFRLNTTIFEELDVLCGYATVEELAAKRKAAAASADLAEDTRATSPAPKDHDNAASATPASPGTRGDDASATPGDAADGTAATGVRTMGPAAKCPFADMGKKVEAGNSHAPGGSSQDSTAIISPQCPVSLAGASEALSQLTWKVAAMGVVAIAVLVAMLLQP